MKRGSGLLGALVGILLLALPATAATVPGPGTACGLSGTTVTAAGRTYVCQSQGGTLRWSKGLKVSKAALRVTNAWVKVAETGMSAAFAVIRNTGKQDVVLIGAASPNAPTVQIHEVVMKAGSSVMQQMRQGLRIKAGATVTLQPGGRHLMLMGITKPIAAGDLVRITLTTTTGGQVTFTALGKVFAGANEQYNPTPAAM